MKSTTQQIRQTDRAIVHFRDCELSPLPNTLDSGPIVLFDVTASDLKNSQIVSFSAEVDSESPEQLIKSQLLSPAQLTKAANLIKLKSK